MNRTPQLASLLFLVAIIVLLDVVMAVIVLWHESNVAETPYHGIFIGLICGQFGLCCAARLRFDSWKLAAYAGMAICPLIAIATLLTSAEGIARQNLSVMVMLAAGFTALYCLGPRSLFRWLSSHQNERQFSMKELFAGTLLVSFGCILVMNVQLALGVALGVFFLALPTIVGCNLLANAQQLWIFSGQMVVGLFFCIVTIPFVPPNVFYMFAAQLLVLWLGGIQLISFRKLSSHNVVIGLPEE